jgi:hypothetical protein
VPRHPLAEVRAGNQQDDARAGERGRQRLGPVEVGEADVDAAVGEVGDGVDPPAGGDDLLGGYVPFEQRLHGEAPEVPGRAGDDNGHVHAFRRQAECLPLCSANTFYWLVPTLR